ncbi:MAG: hypothetical protein AAGI49_05500 [Bacteroidota bacterium]
MRSLLFSLIILSSTACASKKAMTTNDKYQAKANELAQKYIITDGHVDLPFRLRINSFKLEKEFLGIPIETAEGDFDYVRAKKGGLDAPFMSIYISASYQKEGGA